MGCARSKPKSRSFDSSSKSTTHTKTSKSKRTTNVTVQVPDTPVTPVDTTKQQTKTPLIPEILLTPPENDHYLQKENSLNLSEALERSRKKREEFYNSLTISQTNNSNVFTTPVSAGKIQYDNASDERVKNTLKKVFDCKTKHKLNDYEFLSVKTHLVNLLNNMIDSLKELKQRFVEAAHLSDQLITDYEQVKTSITLIRNDFAYFDSLIEASIKLNDVNFELKKNLRHMGVVSGKELGTSGYIKPTISYLLSQLDQINNKLPKRPITCECIKEKDQNNNNNLQDFTVYNQATVDASPIIDLDIDKPMPRNIKNELADCINELSQVASVTINNNDYVSLDEEIEQNIEIYEETNDQFEATIESQETNNQQEDSSITSTTSLTSQEDNQNTSDSDLRLRLEESYVTNEVAKLVDETLRKEADRFMATNYEIIESNQNVVVTQIESVTELIIGNNIINNNFLHQSEQQYETEDILQYKQLYIEETIEMTAEQNNQENGSTETTAPSTDEIHSDAQEIKASQQSKQTNKPNKNKKKSNNKRK